MANAVRDNPERAEPAFVEMLGGLDDSSSVILWSLLAPLGAVAFDRPKRAWPWFAGVVFATALPFLIADPGALWDDTIAYGADTEFTVNFTNQGEHDEQNVLVRVAIRGAGEPIELDCDPERVAQVLRILLDNALVHTPEGTGVRVSAARANGHVRLEVSDRGLGIKRQNMPHIFEPFFTSNDDAQGAGLGLAIASELAGHMQGQLLARSTSGGRTSCCSAAQKSGGKRTSVGVP